MLRRVKVCPSCGRENPDDARFCSQCATPLGDAAQAAREERKVVTCLFCDLVGFTARAERMDPEDVRRLLQPYHGLVRTQLERFGGTVEKFIGDAVMAIFGAPTAHEDDPERAVRAALAIRDTLEEEGELEVRIGITTGEALIALDARPETGEGMASGDVVNTASRLQAAAPTGAVLVDEATYRATDRTVEFEEALAVEAKGKAEPVPVWRAVRARARVGVERVGGADLVGRERELTLLRETFGRVARERSPQLLTLVGVPGIGKSRLVFELFATIQTGEFGLVYWRHGRSLPYGEGVTFWALGEVMKAQAGILESDTPSQAAEKVGRAVRSVIPESAEASWVERHVRSLAGLDSESAAEEGQRGEAFAAWRRFLEGLADERALVVVFEDLHWADEAMLDFVDYLADWTGAVPLLVLCTARPELLTRRPGWSGGKVNSSTILLAPLTEDETAALVHALLGRSVIEAGLQARLLEHAGGNPLYAEEFTRMLSERPGATLVPETVQGLIAARLDTLERDDKDLLSDAAVVGRSFWMGALGDDRGKLEERLHRLERAEFIRRERRSSFAGEVEYTFRHALMRDVAYEQIPRAQRPEKHLRSAEWIESLGRPDDHAEMLAHHYGAALEYARATGGATDAFAERSRDAFRDAGDRSFALHAFGTAVQFYERSLELWDEKTPPELLLRYGRALAVANDERGTGVLERAVEGLLAADDREAAAEAHAFLTEALQQQGRGEAAYEHIGAALALVRDSPPSQAKARVLTELSRLLALGERSEAQVVAQEAFEMADELGLTALAARALGNLGIARSMTLDFDHALADLERSAAIAHSVGSPEEARSLHNLGSTAWFRAELAQTAVYAEQAARLSEEFGGLQMAMASHAVLCSAKYHLGLWDEALVMASDLISRLESGFPSYFEYHPRAARARIQLGRGADDDLALVDVRRAVEASSTARDLQAVSPPLSQLVFVAAELGLLGEARDAGRELASFLAEASPINVHRTIEAAWFAERVGCDSAIRRLASTCPEAHPWRRIVLAILDREFDRAAELLAAIGHIDEGYARLCAGERHLAEGRAADADTQLRAAIAFHRPLGASRYVRRAQELLAGAGLEIPA
jgi:class 3 adenylate cyclase/tetratricopeptide (TPR) repeat protein